MTFRLITVIAIFTALTTASFADEAHYTDTPIKIDGEVDAKWEAAGWRPMPFLMAGSEPDPADFSGRYKLLWDEGQLYILAEIVDDILFDQHADPRHFYWDDDALEIFVDEDLSGGNHQFNHSAFAYHVALDGQAPDIGGPNNPDGSMNVVLLNNHLKSVWKRSADNGNRIIWEVALKLYDKTFDPEKKTKPVTLFAGKKIGFMLAYCDNDGSEYREHFMGSHDIEPVNGDKNRGYIDASVFGELTLVQ